MGVAFLVMWPMAYTDTTETWRLTDRHKRLQVACAGIATELVVAVWATLAWTLLPEGVLRGAMFALATTSWVATLAVNASPFMRFDGYFILCDALDMPNLHERSFALARWKLREALFALGAPPPEHFSRRRQAALIAFAWTTWLYRLVVFLGIAVLVYHFFTKLLGVFLFVVEIAWFVALPIWRELKAWYGLRTQVAARPASRRRMRRVATGVLLLAALTAVPWPGRVGSSGWLQPAQVWPIYAPAAAQLQALHHAEGARVPQGATLLRLDSPALDSRREVLAARTRHLGWQVDTAALLPEVRHRWQVSQEELATTHTEAAGVHAQGEQLAPTAPFDATLRDLDPDLHPGQWLPVRERIATLVGEGPMRVETYLDEHAVKRVRPGDRGLFITDAGEGPALRLTVLQVDADASRQLAHGMLAASAGGDVLTRERQGQRVPEHAVYRVVLQVDSPPADLAGRAWRGRVTLRAAGEPLASRYLRQALTVLVREAGL
jgi:putative peptide zinc metalloprotease protein